MGVRGPAPTPTRLLRLRGSWRAKRRAAEPQPKRARLRPPASLSDEAKKAFRALARQLHAQQVAGGFDAQALARYCDLLVDYWKAAEFVAKHGGVYPVRGKPGKDGEPGQILGFRTYPQAALKLALAGELLRLEREFGLTPSARSRVAAEPPSPSEATFNYFNGGGVE